MKSKPPIDRRPHRATGKPPGRPSGVKNKRTVALEKAASEAMAKVAEIIGPDCFAGDAHALLVTVYKDPSIPLDTRLDAAKAAIGYEKPRLANVDSNVNADIRQTISREPLTDDEWARQYGAGNLAATTGASKSAH